MINETEIDEFYVFFCFKHIILRKLCNPTCCKVIKLHIIYKFWNKTSM